MEPRTEGEQDCSDLKGRDGVEYVSQYAYDWLAEGGGVYDLSLRGEVTADCTWAEAMVAEGFSPDPAFVVGGARKAFEARVYVAPRSRPTEYLAVIRHPGMPPNQPPVGVTLSGWPALAAFLTHLAPLVALFDQLSAPG